MNRKNRYRSKVMNKLSYDDIAEILPFLDANTLLIVSCINSIFCTLTNKKSLWKSAASALGTLYVTNLDAEYVYQNNWKCILKEENHRSISNKFVWTISHFSTLTKRLYSQSFFIQNFKFQLIMDPLGNPNSLFENEAISVYLKYDIPKNNTEIGLEECCCSFALGCKYPLGYVEWVSELEHHRFHKDTDSWGTHALVPLSKIHDKKLGILQNDCLTLYTNMVLLFIKIKVFYQGFGHQGFGIHDLGKETLNYELLQCTSLKKWKAMLQQDLQLSGTDRYRIWIYYQENESNSVLSPKNIINAKDDTTIFKIFEYYLNRWKEVRVWVELVQVGIPRIIYSSNIILFLKYFKQENFYCTHTITESSLPLHTLFSTISSITGYDIEDMKAILETTPYMCNSFSSRIVQDNNNTISSSNITNGDILCFFRKDHESIVTTCYENWTIEVVNDIHNMLNSKTYLNQIKLSDVVLAYEKLGCCDFRIIDIYDSHENIHQTLSYLKDRHIGYWCDICGCKDIKGIRYKCMECKDYDICSECYSNHHKNQFLYKYQVINNGASKIKISTPHRKEHKMMKIKPIITSGDQKNK